MGMLIILAKALWVRLSTDGYIRVTNLARESWKGGDIMDEATEAKKSHRNCLLRIAKAYGFKDGSIKMMDNWEIEDLMLSRIEQGKLACKRSSSTIKQLKKEIDMLRQTSIFDFLKIHHEEIKSQQTASDMEDNG